MRFYFYIQKYASYFLFFALFIGITAPALWSDGMFMDGAIYADISRNLAQGNGSFWHLHFTQTMMHNFYEHPPLAFYLNSFLFKIFGDSIFVERFYSLLTGFAAAGLIFLILKTSFNKSKDLPIIALFVWLLFPLVNWTYANNMLENTVTVFVLLSTYFLLLNFKKRSHLMILFAGISLFAAFLTKGLTALFIWSVPFFYFLIFRQTNLKQLIFETVFLIFYTILPIIILFISSEDANPFFIHYFNDQIFRSINHVQTVNNRLYIIASMLNEMIIPSGLIIILVIIRKIKKSKIKFETEHQKQALFFFLISLAGILPIMISMKQRSFYIVPALPFLAISFAFIFYDLRFSFSVLDMFFKNKFFRLSAYGLFGMSLIMIFIFAGKPGRDKDEISDIYEIKKEIPTGEMVGVDKRINADWSLYAYMQRYGKYSLTNDQGRSNYYLTTDKTFNDKRFKKIKISLKKYILYKRIESE